MVKFLVDENLSHLIASYLRNLGYDAQAVREAGLTGKSDEDIVSWAKENNATIITRDLGFGYTYALKDPTFGLILLRSKDNSAQAFITILSKLEDAGYLHVKKPRFVIATVKTIRMFRNRE